VSGRIPSSAGSRRLPRQSPEPGRDRRMTIHLVSVGETVVADSSAVLVMRTAGSAVMVLHDPVRQVAAAAHFALPHSRAEQASQSRSVPADLFARLLARGSRPQDLELYAVGPGLPLELPGAQQKGAPAGPPARVALGCRVDSIRAPRRVEFSVDMGRMVVEGGCRP